MTLKRYFSDAQGERLAKELDEQISWQNRLIVLNSEIIQGAKEEGSAILVQHVALANEENSHILRQVKEYTRTLGNIVNEKENPDYETLLLFKDAVLKMITGEYPSVRKIGKEIKKLKDRQEAENKERFIALAKVVGLEAPKKNPAKQVMKPNQ